MGTIIEVCSACGSSTDQSKSVVICIWYSIELLFYIFMTGLCLREFWKKKQNKQRLLTKKSFVLYTMCGLSIFQIMNITIKSFSFIKIFDLYARQILFCCVLFYFIHKYYKMTDSKKITKRKIFICVFLLVILAQIALMVFSFLSSDGINSSNCEDLTGLWLRIVGTIIGFIFVSIGFLFYKKFSIQKQNFISLFTIEQEQGIKNFLDSEDKLEDLLKLIVVYFSTQFLLLCVLIYYELQILDQNDNQNITSCTVLPPVNFQTDNQIFKTNCIKQSYLDQTGDGGKAGEYALRSFIQIIVTFLPQIYLFNLFKYKKPRTHYSHEMKKSLISNEDHQNGFGRNIQFNNFIRSRKNNNNADSSNNEVSISHSFVSYNDV